MFKGLAASGWHTAAMAMRLAVETRPFGPHPLLGLGVDELRWLAPVRPDDVIHLEGEVIELTPSRSKPQGIARVKWTAFNQRGEPVYTFTPMAIVPRAGVNSPRVGGWSVATKPSLGPHPDLLSACDRLRGEGIWRAPHQTNLISVPVPLSGLGWKSPVV